MLIQSHIRLGSANADKRGVKGPFVAWLCDGCGRMELYPDTNAKDGGLNPLPTGWTGTQDDASHNTDHLCQTCSEKAYANVDTGLPTEYDMSLEVNSS